MASRLDELCAILIQAPADVFIQTHDVPDPDAIAAAFGLQCLLKCRGLAARIIYNSRIEKPDTIRMLSIFNIEVTAVNGGPSPCNRDWAVLIDAQKGSGNILDLPCQEVAVIDHHQLRHDTAWQFADIRPEIGSCSAIIAEYYFDNQYQPEPEVATALFYGIMIDTDYLGRGVSELDSLMVYKLFPLIDQQRLAELRSSQISRQDLAVYARAFSTLEVYDGLGFLELGPANDSLIGAATDILLSVDEVQVAVCYSVREADIKISIRSSRQQVLANELAAYIVAGHGFGGGHPHMAGGLIPRSSLPAGRQPGLFIRHRCIQFCESLSGQSE